MNKLITGGTRLLGIVGDPVRQARAPEVWTSLFRLNGIDAVCVPMHVSPAGFQSFVNGMKTMHNLIGMIVTVPHKPAAASLVHHLSERARVIGAANVLRWNADGELAGDITDGVGFVRGMRACGNDFKGKRVLIVGSGGVGTAIALAVAGTGCAEIGVSDTSRERAQTLCNRINSAGTASHIAVAAAQGFDLVINATPVGMRPDDPLPIDCDGLSPATVVADVIMDPLMTKLLTAAKERGCAIHQGTHMMDHSIHEMAQFFGLEGNDWGVEAVARAVTPLR